MKYTDKVQKLINYATRIEDDYLKGQLETLYVEIQAYVVSERLELLKKIKSGDDII